ncbi:TIGR03790 family protein [Rubritalea tangerina]|uniref:TIGR03790 family protein n=1 Tax=Rubritalea tangerina TaxID=430798 RepID=A0ABW4ZCV6_9BACT
MPKLLFSLFLLALSVLHASASIPPNQVVVLYNTNLPDSSKLAFYYAKQRGIPQENLVGLDTPNSGHITREQFSSSIQEPLRRHFTQNKWWQIAKSSDGYQLPVANQKRLLVCMYGIPFGIRNKAIPKAESDKMHLTQRPNSAAVDSELTIFGIHNAPLQGPLPNKYFKKNTNFTSLRELTPYFLVGRIDGPDFATSKRLIDDAIATERQGLWGMCYLDLALKGGGYQIGDDWINKIDQVNWTKGLPTTIDKNKQTYLSHYPMRDASLYYGWYTGSKNGPLLDPNFRFKRGAVAIHLHSFSAARLRDKNKHWVGPILAKGAAATVGNVYEPYLQMTHHFDLLHQRLLEGHTFIEAATMALPVLSWQNLTVGDPLYRPFKHLDGSGSIADEDKLYRSVNLAFRAWKNNPEQIEKKLTAAAISKNDARYYEILGLWQLHLGNQKQAASFFFAASKKFKTNSDKIRIALHLANLYRGEKNKKLATEILEDTLIGRENHPSSTPIKAMLNVINPPPPPPAQPRKQPQNPKK